MPWAVQGRRASPLRRSLFDPESRRRTNAARRCRLWVGGLVSAVLLGGAGAASQPMPAMILEAGVLNARAGAGAGIAKAGTLCLPSGRLHVGDFVEDAEDFTSQVRAAFNAANIEQPINQAVPSRMLKVSLEGIAASLCARKFGVFGRGDRQSMSGSADFHFTWSLSTPGSVAAASRAETVHLDVRKNEAKPTEQLLADALTVLARRVVAASAGS